MASTKKQRVTDGREEEDTLLVGVWTDVVTVGISVEGYQKTKGNKAVT